MKKEFMDYYKILGVSKYASFEEIKEAYNLLVKELRSKSQIIKNKKEINKMHEKFSNINEAYKILRDDYKRALYNIELRKYYREQKINEVKQNEEYLKKRKSKKKKENSLLNKLSKSYKEVREDEKKYPFYKRHEKISQSFDREFDDYKDTLPKTIVFKTLKGTCHIFGETLYQIKKLGYITEDSTPKFIIRNRKAIGAVVLCGILSTSVGNFGKDEKNIEVSTQEYTMENEIEDNELYYQSEIELNRTYKIKGGDTLTAIANKSGTPISTIMRLNGIESENRIYMGDTIKIPYYVSMEDLKYYTEIVNTNNMTLQEIANKYETTIETLYKLNEEAITKMGDNSFILLTDNIIVPKFITKTELKEMKETNINYK